MVGNVELHRHACLGCLAFQGVNALPDGSCISCSLLNNVQAWPAGWYEGLNDAQRAVLEPPYVKAQERPELGDDGELTEESKDSIAASGWDGIGRNPLTGKARL